MRMSWVARSYLWSMNFDGFGGMALAVVAGLWLLVFVPSWFKRAQDRERGVSNHRPSVARARRRQAPVKRASVDNFVALAREFAGESAESAVEISDPRAWQRNELPEPRAFMGTLETPELAEVSSLEAVRETVAARKLEQSELDEILRRRRANG
jgi:hypothetical protein